jgi:hypothetical protein
MGEGVKGQPSPIEGRVRKDPAIRFSGNSSMESFEVATPILNTPFDEPAEYWLIEDGKLPERMPGGGRPGITTAVRRYRTMTSTPRAANGGNWRWSI